MHPKIYNLDPEGLNPYPKEKITWAMIKHTMSTPSRIDPWLERIMSVQRRTERPPVAGRPAPRRPLGPRQGRLIKSPEGSTPRGDQDRPIGRRCHVKAGPGLWRNHPKLLGPGALIFVAKQL